MSAAMLRSAPAWWWCPAVAAFGAVVFGAVVLGVVVLGVVLGVVVAAPPAGGVSCGAVC